MNKPVLALHLNVADSHVIQAFTICAVRETGSEVSESRRKVGQRASIGEDLSLTDLFWSGEPLLVVHTSLPLRTRL